METKIEKRLDPTDNKLQISNKKPARHYQFLSKIFLKKFGKIELHALGEAISVAVVAAELLQRNELATITSMKQFTFLPEEEKQSEQKQTEAGND